jgi:hypothetical protein
VIDKKFRDQDDEDDWKANLVSQTDIIKVSPI